MWLAAHCAAHFFAAVSADVMRCVHFMYFFIVFREKYSSTGESSLSFFSSDFTISLETVFPAVWGKVFSFSLTEVAPDGSSELGLAPGNNPRYFLSSLGFTSRASPPSFLLPRFPVSAGHSASVFPTCPRSLSASTHRMLWFGRALVSLSLRAFALCIFL